MKIKVPGDIRRYIAVRVGGRILACTALLAAVITGVTLNLADIMERGISYAVLLYAVPVLLVFIVTGVPLKLIDSTWCGEIVEHKTNTVIQSKINGAYYKTGLDAYGSKMSEYRHILTVKVRLADESIVSFKVCDTNDADYLNIMLSDYKVGTKVLHVYGTKHLLITDSDRENVRCVICGEKNPKEERLCGKCKHSLIIDK